MACIRMSRAIVRWERSSLERSKTIFAVPNARSSFTRKDQMGSRLSWPSMDRAARTHILGFIVVLAVALVLHYGFLPFFGRRVGIRETPAYFLAIALVPVSLWLVPAFSRALARGAYEAHRKLFGGEGVYIRLPAAEPVRLRDTILMSIGPFAALPRRLRGCVRLPPRGRASGPSKFGGLVCQARDRNEDGTA